MSRSKIVQDAEFGMNDSEYQDDVSSNIESEIGDKEQAKTRKRIDDLLEKKRLKELLDEDDWEL